MSHGRTAPTLYTSLFLRPLESPAKARPTSTPRLCTSCGLRNRWRLRAGCRLEEVPGRPNGRAAPAPSRPHGAAIRARRPAHGDPRRRTAARREAVPVTRRGQLPPENRCAECVCVCVCVCVFVRLCLCVCVFFVCGVFGKTRKKKIVKETDIKHNRIHLNKERGPKTPATK